MAFSFPSSPSTNDTYTVGSRTYTWTGSVWEMTGGLITTSQLTDLGVTTGKIDNLAITAGKLASDAVTTAKILDANVTAGKLASGAAVSNIGYTPANIASPTFTGTVTLPSTTSIGTVSATEIGYVDGVTSAIQTQLDSKLTATTAATSNRNVVINGAMQVHQRGASTASITTNGYYTADRYLSQFSSLGTWTQSVEADAPTGSGFRNSLKMLCTTADAAPAAGDFLAMTQALEGQNVQQFLKGTSAAKPFALSFWVKSNVTGTYIAELRDSDNNRQVSASYTVSASATWEKKTIIFPADTTGAFDNDNNSSLALNFWLGSGTDRTSGTLQTTWATLVNANRVVGQTNVAAATNNYWQITGVQLEAGAVATPFEFEDFGTTLQKCQRYFEKSYNVDTAPGTASTLGQSIGLGIHTNTPAAYSRFGSGISFKVPKRTTPTVVQYAPASGSSAAASNTTSGDGSTAVGYVSAQQINQNGFNLAAGIGGTTTTGYFTIFIAYTASAEL